MTRYSNPTTRGEGVVYYPGDVNSPPDSDLTFARDMMTPEEFYKLDIEYQEFLLSVSDLFSVQREDEELKDYVSKVLNRRFEKGYLQLCAGVRVKNSYGRPRIGTQEDYRLGDANTCAERFVLDELERENLEADALVVYRGENVTNRDGELQTIKEHGGVKRGKNKGVMRHMVSPCIYCREGLCQHDPATMVVLPPPKLRPGKTTIKLPAFMLYPDEGLFTEKDPLQEKLAALGKPELLEARKRQRDFFRKVVKRYKPSPEDEQLFREAYQEIQNQPPIDDPYFLFCARTITERRVKEKGSEKIQPFSYLKYARNDVATRFINKLHQQRPLEPENEQRPGRWHSLNVFVQLQRDPSTGEIRTALPNADTRQKLAENFKMSFILIKVNGKFVKVPFPLCNPSPYKRVDKEAADNELRA